LEKASEMALTFNATGIAPVKSILLKGLDLQNTLEFPVSKPITHENIRGETYFNHSEERVES
jgi:hypothetical protein